MKRRNGPGGIDEVKAFENVPIAAKNMPTSNAPIHLWLWQTENAGLVAKQVTAMPIAHNARPSNSNNNKIVARPTTGKASRVLMKNSRSTSNDSPWYVHRAMASNIPRKL